MIAAVSEAKVSVEIRSIAETLPIVKFDDLPHIARLLVRLADLAQAQELELQLLRDMEAGRELRAGVSTAIAVQFSDPDDNDNVIFSEFGRKG